MKTDLYTKVALTIIAISLAVIAYKQIPGPDHRASHTINSEQISTAEGKFANYVFTGNASGGVDLSQVRGLETIKHESPSGISIDNHLPPRETATV